MVTNIKKSDAVEIGSKKYDGSLFLLGLILAAIGIYISRQSRMFTFSIDFLEPLLKQRYGIVNYPELLIGGIIALVGGVMLGLICRRLLPDTMADFSLPVPKWNKNYFALASLMAGIICTVFLYWHLSTKQYTHWDILLFFAGLIFFGLAIHLLDRREPAQRLNLTKLDAAIVLFLFMLTLGINLIGLLAWNFSVIGDEGAFLDFSTYLADGGNWNFFKLNGVYGDHPELDSAYQALIMKSFGVSMFSWRLSEVLLAGVTVVILYFIVNMLFGRLPAFAAGIILGSSHYLMAFNRIAYNNTHSLFYSTLAIFLLVLAFRTKKLVLIFSAGCALGLCLYTFANAMLTWPIIFIFLSVVFLKKPKKSFLAAASVMFLGFMLVITPALIFSSIHHVTRLGYASTSFSMLPQNQEIEGFLWLAENNLIHSTLSFFSEKGQHHYVGVALVDVITGILLLAGLSIAIFRLNKNAELLTFLWFSFGLVIIAITNRADSVSITRLLYILPPIAILGAIAIANAYSVMRLNLKINERAVYAILIAVLLSIPLINLYQLHVESPKGTSMQVWNMKLRALQDYPGLTITEVVNNNLQKSWIKQIAYYPSLASRYAYVDVSNLSIEKKINNSAYLVDGTWGYNKKILENVNQTLFDYSVIDLHDQHGGASAWLFVPPGINAGKREWSLETFFTDVIERRPFGQN